jgi:hypothetical protein
MLSASFKFLHTLFVCLLVPVYWYHYGPSNFLWFSDIALLASVVALWTKSGLLASTQALSVTILELFWTVDFLVRLIFGVQMLGLSGYMFDSTLPLGLRALSLFHLWLPWLLIWMIYRFGYDRRALLIQTLVCWVVLLTSYWLCPPGKNINWVYGLGSQPQTYLPPIIYLLLLMAAIPALIYLPTHLVFHRFERKWEGRTPASK